MHSFKIFKQLESNKTISQSHFNFIRDGVIYMRYDDITEIKWLQKNYSNLGIKQICFSNYDYKLIFKYFLLFEDIFIRNIEYDYDVKDELIDDIKRGLIECINEKEKAIEIQSFMNELIDNDISITKLTITIKQTKMYIYSNGMITIVENKPDDYIFNLSTIFKGTAV